MDNDDDVEHLFSWLQTPELRYREFAGAREITDSVMIVQQRRANNTAVPEDRPVGAPHHDTQLNEEYPQDQFPDQGETRVEMIEEVRPTARDNPRVVVRENVEVEVREEAKATVRGDAARVVVREETKVEVREEVRGAARGPLIIAPVAVDVEAPAPMADAAGVFALGASGRDTLRSGPAEWAGPRPPLIQTPAPAHAAPSAYPVAAPPAVPAQGGRLLGGAYRENEAIANGAPAVAPEPPAEPAGQQGDRSLDAVFGRLSGGRSRLPDPRERLRHIPGLGRQGAARAETSVVWFAQIGAGG